jgi:hypothetical protein
MLLKSRAVAFAGMATALAVIIVTIAGYIDVSTLFLLALASFIGGIVTRYFKVRYGVLFLLASVTLSFILAPQKMYVLTYLAMTVYVIVEESIDLNKSNEHKTFSPVKEWIIKALVYNVLLAVIILVNYYLLGLDMYKFSGVYRVVMSNLAFGLPLMILVLELVMVVFDRAYVYFMRVIDHRLLNRMK